MPTKTASVAAFVIAAGGGAAAEFLLDPQNGKRRRHMIRDQVMAKVRRGSREAVRKAHYIAGKARGVAAEATPPGHDSSELNDPALRGKVESELFRPIDAPKSSVDVDVQERIVFLRGEVESPERVEELVRRAEAIDGVDRVESLLHLPGEPAPH